MWTDKEESRLNSFRTPHIRNSLEARDHRCTPSSPRESSKRGTRPNLRIYSIIIQLRKGAEVPFMETKQGGPSLDKIPHKEEIVGKDSSTSLTNRSRIMWAWSSSKTLMPFKMFPWTRETFPSIGMNTGQSMWWRRNRKMSYFKKLWTEERGGQSRNLSIRRTG